MAIAELTKPSLAQKKEGGLDYVVGSGLSGVACAKALLARGREVTMLDAGLRLPHE